MFSGRPWRERRARKARRVSLRGMSVADVSAEGPCPRKRRALRRRQQLLRVAAGTVVRAVRAEHAAELGHDVGVIERLDRSAGHLRLRGLLDPEVTPRERGDLRQVGDADDLALLPERAQALADGSRGLPADAGIDL